MLKLLLLPVTLLVKLILMVVGFVVAQSVALVLTLITQIAVFAGVLYLGYAYVVVPYVLPLISEVVG